MQALWAYIKVCKVGMGMGMGGWNWRWAAVTEMMAGMGWVGLLEMVWILYGDCEYDYHEMMGMGKGMVVVDVNVDTVSARSSLGQ